MLRACFLALLTGLLLAPAVPAQTPWRLRWQPGQVLTYRVEQVTSATDIAPDSKVETATRLNLVKRWQVLAVDAQGVGTLQLSTPVLRIETTTPKGEVLLFDSADLEKSTPQMREQLLQYVNQPLAVIRMDAKGQVIEVKECKFGTPSRFESDLPFVVALPDEGPRMGQAWERSYRITLDPPQGTGEKYDAIQQYVCKSITADAATVSVTTLVKTLPDSLVDRIPLLQMQPEGEVVFDPRTGFMRSARTRIDKTLTGHQGEGSSYRFQSNYTEEFVGR